MSKLWSARFTHLGSHLLDDFNASIHFDKQLYTFDIQGSLVHAKMLAKIGILNDKELKSINDGLDQIKLEIDQNKFEFNTANEDIHMSIEQRLTEIIGIVGKKLHTARSRNDQVAVDFRLYTRLANAQILKRIHSFIETLIYIASKHTKTLLPGTTHLQHAQPISYAFNLLAYVNMLSRDFNRFHESLERNNLSPLGACALAGTTYNTDRHFTAQKLGFKAPTVNALDTVSDRDFALEILFNISVMFMHLSRFAEEIIIFCTSEYSFLTLSDTYSTGSSIMPQKKNPDVAELVRGKTGRAYGNLISLLTVMKGLSLAYNKDMQEDKEPVFDSVNHAIISLDIMKAMCEEMTVNVDNMLKATKIGHLSATDLADYLVQKNIAFREAYGIVGQIVAKAESLGKDLSELDLQTLQSIDNRIGADALEKIDLFACMDNRNSYGGTGTKPVKDQIKLFKAWLQESKKDFEQYL